MKLAILIQFESDILIRKQIYNRTDSIKLLFIYFTKNHSDVSSNVNIEIKLLTIKVPVISL